MKNNIKNLQIKLCYPVEKIFNNIVNNITDVKTDNIKYPNEICYFSNSKYIANYNKKNKYFGCEYYGFWLKFKFNDSFNYLTIRYLLNSMIEEHFKLKDITTYLTTCFLKKKVEEHFKLKGITTSNANTFFSLR